MSHPLEAIDEVRKRTKCSYEEAKDVLIYTRRCAKYNYLSGKRKRWTREPSRRLQIR